MTYVVEIEDKNGCRAIKEYEASSAYDLANVVTHELRAYPGFKAVGAWQKSAPGKQVYFCHRGTLAG